MEPLKRKLVTTLLQGPKDKVDSEDSDCLGVRGGPDPKPGSLAPLSCLDTDVGVAFQQWELKSLLWKEGNGWGHYKFGPLGSPSFPNPGNLLPPRLHSQ